METQWEVRSLRTRKDIQNNIEIEESSPQEREAQHAVEKRAKS